MSNGREIERRHDATPAPRSAEANAPGRPGTPGGFAAPGSSGDEPWSPGGGDLRTYLEILLRRRRLALGIFLAVVVGVLAATLMQPRIYRATGLIEIRRQGGGDVGAERLMAAEELSETGMRTQYELLRSAALARRVIRDLELYRLSAFRPDEDERVGSGGRVVEAGIAGGAGEGPGGGRAASAGEGPSAGEAPTGAASVPGEGVSAVALQGAVRAFRNRLTVNPKAESRLVEVSFDYEDPEVAARVVNSVLTGYVDMRVGTGRNAASWLDTQMDSVRADLAASEGRLHAYADRNGLPYVVDEDVSERIGERVRRLQDELATAESERYEKESLRDMVVQRGEFEAVDDRVVEELSLRLAELRSEYARISSTFTDEYPPVREVRREIEEVEGLLREERSRIVRQIENDYQVAVRGEEMLRQSLEEEQAAAELLARRSGTYHLMRQEVLANRELFAALRQSQQQVRVGAALEATGVAIVDRALPPEDPHRPLMAYNMALAMMGGLLFGIGGALVREYFDDTVQTGQDVGRTVDLPVLAMIPSLGTLEKGNGGTGETRQRLLPRLGGGSGPQGSPERWVRIDGPEAASDANRALMEAFGTLRTSMLFKADGPPPRSLLVSSCLPGDGKTTISMNLALSLTRLDRRVLLVDGDLRRPCLHRALGMPRAPGLTDHLADGRDWRELVRHDERTGMHALLSGRPADNPGDLLSRPRAQDLIRQTEEEYDFVIFDAPALFVNVPDARLLSRLVSGVVVVVRSGATPRPLVGRILEATPGVLGVIVNDLDVHRFPDYYREYPSPAAAEALPKNGGSA